MEDSKINISANVSNSISYVTRQCEIYLANKYHDFNKANSFSFIRGIRILNNTDKDILDTTLKIEFNTPEIKNASIDISCLDKNKIIEITNNLNFEIDPTKLYELNEVKVINLSINLYDSQNNLLASRVYPLKLMPLNQISSGLKSDYFVPEMLTCFVTPNDDYVNEVVKKATKILQGEGKKSFMGYLANDPNFVIKELDAIYKAIRNEGISYSMPPASFEKIFQRVRLPQEVLRTKQGTCLDMTILFASAIENIGLHPIIFLTKKHAFVGCWLEETFRTGTREDNSTIFSEASEKGIGKLALIETTLVCSGQTASFNDAIDVARSKLIDDIFEYGIDVNSCRESEIYKPIPTPKSDGKTEIQFEVVDILNEKPIEVDTSLRDKYIKKEKGKDKFDLWERKLLDLSLSNKLINCKSRKNSLNVLIDNPQDLFIALSQKDKFNLLGFSAKEKGIDSDILSYKDKNYIGSSINNGKLIIETDAVKYEDEIKKLARRSNSAYEESGSNILFMSVGLIEWYPNESSVYPNYAPLLLIPAQLSQRKVGRFYTVDFFLDEARLNITFLEYVKQTFNINVDLNGNDLSIDDNGVIGYDEICNTLTRELNIKNWKIIKDKAFIDTFSFSHFVMWEDICNRKSLLLKNPVISSLYYGNNKRLIEGNDGKEIDIDKNIKPKDLAIPLSADSSQIEAILSCAKGESFVLFGPPGTGKSQTIANMIVNLMYQGKSVLFVAEKMVALEVVKHRLDEIGLGNFCIQIHSNKISKSEVLNQIDNALQMQNIEAPKDAENKAQELLDSRNELNERLKKLHSNKKYFASLYDAILMYEDLKKKGCKKSIPINDDYFNSLNKSMFDDSYNTLKNIEVFGNDAGGYKDNAFNFYKGDTYNLVIRNEVESKIKSLFSRIEEIVKFDDSFAKSYGFRQIKDLKDLNDFTNLMNLLLEKESLNFESLIDFDYAEKDELSNAYLDSKIKELSHKEKVLRRFSENIFEIDEESLLNNLEEAKNYNFFKRFIFKNKIVKKLSIYSLDKEQKIKRKELDEILNNIRNYKKLNELNKKVDKSIYYHFDKFKNKTSSEYLDTKNLFNNTKEFYKAIINSSFYKEKDINSFEKLYKNKEKLFSTEISKYIEFNNNFYKEVENLKDNDNIDFMSLDISFENMALKIKKALHDIGKFNLWVLLNSELNKAKKLKLDFVLDEYKKGSLSTDELALTYQFSIYYKLIASYFNIYDFNEFTKPTVEKNIKEYERLIEEYSKLTVENVAAKITQSSPVINSEYVKSSESAQIRKLIKSNGRGTSLRQIINNLGSFIKKLCPCFLMSPLSIAQYIDIEKMHFDVVIFDEASQIPTSEAVGAIARGDSVVIAGDYNQMPPTSFFKTQIDNNVSFFENESDLDSLLDDCISIGLPQRNLLWHYRSHHESLIAFSNSKFYKNNLYTFPSPSNLISNVKFVNVHGTYERNKGINKAEADAIVKEIIRRLKDPILSQKSIGVVTFNQKQQNLIQDLLDEEYDKNPDLNFRPGNETIFIKNLENVQGDERDVILFSICFAKRKDGELSLNFGPLSLEKGERRLNVAVSRSRDEMIVYSSIEPIDINPSNAKNDGAGYLRDLLEYAKYGVKALTKNIDNNDKQFDLSIAEFIKNDLEKLGYKCDLNIGTSNFRVDIAVKNDKEDAYCLGIICDSSFYYEAKTCRDRNVLHYNVLSKLGWNIFRIWTLDYYDHPNEVVKQIVEKIEETKNGKAKKEEPKQRKTLKESVYFKKKDENSWKKNNVSFVKYKGSIAYPDNDREVITALKGLVNKEAPVTYSYIKESVRKMANLSKISPKFNVKLTNLLTQIGFYHTMTPDTYWSDKELYMSYVSYREYVNFEITNIPYEELGNLFVDILGDLGKIQKNDLFKFVSVFYGYKSLSQKTTNYLEEATHYLTIKNYRGLSQSGDLITIKNKRT